VAQLHLMPPGFMTPGLNLSRYERPLAERRLLGGAVRDRWESDDRLPLRRLTRENDLCGCGMMEVLTRGDASE
jgi:hypothetical protein